MFHVPNQFRVKKGPYGSTDDAGNNGAFEIPHHGRRKFYVIAGDGGMWEHVSVSFPGFNHTPTWNDMCHIKDLFWDEEDCVIQYHPPASMCVNDHPHCLHLWRPVGGGVPLPPWGFV